MRIEKVNNKAFAKVPDRSEVELVSLVNKFFSSTSYNNGSSSGSTSTIDKEALIVEIINRLYPIMVSTAEDISKAEADAAIIDHISTLHVGGGTPSPERTHIWYDKLLSIEDEDMTELLLPQEKFMDLRYGDIYVRVNGADQSTPIHFGYIVNEDNIVTGINFGTDTFYVDDYITVEYIPSTMDRDVLYRIIIGASDSKRYITIDENISIMMTDRVRICINGVEQDRDDAFTLIPYDGNSIILNTVDFGSPILEVGDVITIGS